MKSASSCGTGAMTLRSAELSRAPQAEGTPAKSRTKDKERSRRARRVTTLCHALAAVLILLGLEENARAADNALSAGADEAAKSAISAPPPAPPPVPLGIFADNNLPQGRFVLSITPIFAGLSGLLIGTRGVSNEFAVTTVPFFLNPSQKVRIVPQHINIAAQIVRVRYGVTDDFEMVLDTGWIEKNLHALVFKGTAGITTIGDNYPRTSSLVDTILFGVYRIYQDDIQRIQISLGFSFPTGIDDATFNDFILPNGTRRNIRGFYGMQLGTGTFDILPGVVYAGYLGPWSWGLVLSRAPAARLQSAGLPLGEPARIQRLGWLHLDAWLHHDIPRVRHDAKSHQRLRSPDQRPRRPRQSALLWRAEGRALRRRIDQRKINRY
jgi:hypothetical protein